MARLNDDTVAMDLKKRKIRLSLFFVTIILVSIGIVMIYSSSAIYAYESFGDSAYFLKRHLIYLAIGMFMAALAMYFDYTVLKKYAKPIILFAFLLLILVLIPGIGRQVAGARRWFRFGVLNFQPSVLASVALIIYTAEALSRKQEIIKDFFRGFLPPMLVMGLVVLLVLLEPDLGTAFLLAAIVVIMGFVSGISLSHIIPILVSGIPLFIALIIAKPYRFKRILAFLDPWADSKGAGFQIIQSFLALGSGGLLGVGLAQSKQKLFYLPASHTDFIFSIIGEELGLLGTISIITLFILFIVNGTKIALSSNDLFGQLLGSGVVAMIGIEAIINIAVTTGTIPTKGLPLPFISYGGSSLIVHLIGVGLLLNIGKDIK